MVCMKHLTETPFCSKNKNVQIKLLKNVNPLSILTNNRCSLDKLKRTQNYKNLPSLF